MADDMKGRVRWLVAWVVCMVLGGTAWGQCGGWLAGEGVPGTDERVEASILWDRDGAGPLPPRLVIGGEFDAVGRTAARRVASYDFSTGEWEPLGAGLRDGVTYTTVHAFATLPNGDLVAAGVFSRAGDEAVNNIARWDGSSWHALGTGCDQWVYALGVLPNGDLVAGGRFTTAGGIAATGIARWNGTEWSAVGGGVDNQVQALKLLANGDLIVGGFFRNAGGQPANCIARWNGTSWTGMGAGLNNSVRSVAELSDGSIVAVGGFSIPGGGPANYVARWDGAVWTGVGAGLPASAIGPAEDAVLLGSGDLIVGLGGGMSRWNGVSWTSVPGLFERVRALTVLPGGDLFVGGDFRAAGSARLWHLARWSDPTWSALTDPSARSLDTTGVVVASPSGEVYRTRSSVGTVERWSGSTWAVVATVPGSGFSRLAFRPNGAIIVRRGPTVFEWDGARWRTLGDFSPWNVSALAVRPDGAVVIATTSPQQPRSSVRVLGGSTWLTLGAEFEGTVYELLTLPNGDVVAAGFFSLPGSPSVQNLARWDGTAWSLVGARPSHSVTSVAALPGGDLVIGGGFSYVGDVYVNRVARWDGISWHALGTGLDDQVNDTTVLPNGDLIAGGWFRSAGGQPVEHVARWNGSSWLALGSGASNSVNSVVVTPEGELFAAGQFAVAGGVVSRCFARYSFTGIPLIADQPDSQTITDHDTITLSATPASGYEGVSVQWRRDGVPIVDGPGGASAGGGTVSGAVGVLASPTDGAAAVLTIANARMGDAGTYTATFTNACGEVTTHPAAVHVDPCPADFDADGVVDGEDALGFFAAWDASTAAADFSGDGGVDSDDVIGFFASWDAGC